MKIGYARVSTEEQRPELQIDALKAAGCEKVFCDRGVSAIAKRRPEFEKACAELNEGDVFVIWKFDRAFRSQQQAHNFLAELQGRGVQFQSLTEHIDTNTPHGKAFFGVIQAMAQLERDLISERTKAGLQAARKQGQKLGRPQALTSMQIEWAREMREKGEAMTQIAKSLGVSRSTLYEALKK